MSDPTVSCPSCGHEFRLTDSLAAPLLEATRKRFEQELARKDAEIGGRETALAKERAAVEATKAGVDQLVADRLLKERAALAAEEARKARLALQAELSTRDRLATDLQNTVKELNEKLTSAQNAEVEFRRQQRELADKTRELELVVEKRVTAGLAAVEAKAVQRADEAGRLKLAEKDKVVADALRQVEEMKRRMEQGSQQLQGEVQELDLEAQLRSRFPGDAIEPVPKGEHGGDALHRIVNAVGQACGCILWEAKRTKAWSDGWLGKLRADQRAAKADVAILVSAALPKGVDTFDLVDGVWVTSPRCALPVAIALRQLLVEVASTRVASEGQQTKTQLVYQYLTGPGFRHRVEAIVEKFSEMREDLDRERRSMTKLWAKREGQIQVVLDATAGMYGDLQGIAGKSLQEIAGLETLSLPEPGDVPPTP